MWTYFEERRRIGFHRCLYKVRTWYLLGIRVWRHYEQLTVWSDNATSAELGEE